MAAIKSMKIDLKKIDACNGPLDQMAKPSSSGGPSPAFIMCYSGVWAQYHSAIDQALKTANQYDQLADAGDTNTALVAYDKLITDDYDKVVNSSTDNPKEFWSAVNQLITFAGAVANATSESNLATIKKAVEAIK